MAPPEHALSFEPLRPELLPDWLAFFDGPAFADNRDWGGCYCRCFLFGKSDEPFDAWERACGTGENRGAMSAAIAAGQVDGLVARRAGEIVGWAHFGPSSRFCSMIGTTFPPGPPDQAAIVCFLVAAPARRSGVARALLRASLEELRRRGFRSVVARGSVAHDGDASDGEQFTGPLPLYLSEGFDVVQRSEKRPVVHRLL